MDAAALVTIPACTSKNLSQNLFQYSYSSMFLGGLSCISGFILFKITHIPAGPLIIISSSCLFLLSILLKKFLFNLSYLE
ncbi:metal ABC transporter permease [Candidatus Dependentiae bacterium]